MRSYSVLCVSLVVLGASLLAGCPPPTVGCPAGFTLSSDGRCLPSSDAGPGGDGGLVSDAGLDAATLPMIDAGRGADGCVLTTYFADADHDGHGDASSSMAACEMPAGYVTTGDDCDDASPTIHPGVTEVCEGSHDENCDGHVDEACGCTTGATQACGASATAPCHMGTQSCVAGTWGPCTGNLDPMTETCNGIDDDCDGMPDDGLTFSTYYVDMDGDGFGGAGTMTSCAAPAGYVTTGGDCIDTSATVHPGASESCNGMDDDCSGAPDNGLGCVLGTASTCTTVCGSMGTGLCSATCALPTGTMCTPPSSESCNGRDDNCDGAADESIQMLGSNAPVATGTGLVQPLIIALTSGYGVLYANGTSLVWQTLSAAGVVGTAIPLGSDTAPLNGVYDARFDGTNVVILFQRNTGDYGAFAIAPSSGARVFPTTAGTTMSLPRPTGYLVTLNHVRIVSASAGAASLYVVYNHSGLVLHRWRITTTGVGTVQPGSGDVITTTGSFLPWDALRAGSADYIAYRSTTNDLLLMTTPSDTISAVTASPIGAAGGDSSSQIALGIADHASAPSATNPIGIASAGATNVRVAAFPGATTPVVVTGASPTSAAPLNVVLRLVPAPAHTTRGHWFLVESEPSASTQRVRAWEVLSSGASITTSLVGGITESYAASRTSVSADSDGTSVRIAELDAVGSVVTRSIGCM